MSTVSAPFGLQEGVVDFVRAFGLHRPDRTPCGKPLSVSEAHALMELDGRESVSQSELASALRLEKSTVSRLVSQLIARGWVERGRDDDDGRVRRLRLSDRGARVAAEVAGARREKFESLLARIPDTERTSVQRALRVLVDALDATP
ncbi:MAG: winged helix-turn-helix transcriptional regulator [Actinobacteria bacterium]|nr:winged helix-turn-helix transcriptional regulator [Actinomycetota bacterium]